MNNKINNPKKKVPTGITLNDKDYMNHLLYMLKDLEKNLAGTLTEASNEKLYKEYKKMFDEIANYQREAFELMFKYGWYTLEEATQTKINTSYSTLKTELDDLNN